MKGKELQNAIYNIAKERQFEYGALWPSSWKNKASLLKHAADRLYDFYHDALIRDYDRIQAELEKEKTTVTGVKTVKTRVLKGKDLEDDNDRRMLSVYFLLMGYAVENLLKGILMGQHPEYLKKPEGENSEYFNKPKGKIDDKIKTHDLVKICNDCGVCINNKEKKLLKMLERCILWQSKYPIPLKANGMQREDGMTLGLWTANEEVKYRQTQKELNNLYTKFWRECETVSSRTPATTDCL